MVKIIFHIDLNAFFCSVACIKYPYLKGKAFAIGRPGSTKGVISTASYEAREYGVGSGMPQNEALNKCKNLIIVSHEFSEYRYYHNKFVGVLKTYTDKISVASIDEAYLDMTEASKTNHPLLIAREIQARLLNELSLPSSIGIAPTLFLAKMGSDMKKPLGIQVVRKRDVSKLLFPLGINETYGIGKSTYPRLIAGGIKTIGDFVNKENKEKVLTLVNERTYDYVLTNIFGKSTDNVDSRNRDGAESISTTRTYDYLLKTEEDVLLELRKMTKKLHAKIIEKDYKTKTVGITLRNTAFKTIVRSTSLDMYSNNLYEIIHTIEDLVFENYKGEELRLVGVTFGNLKSNKEVDIEYNLFTYEQYINRDKNIDEIIKKFKSKYGPEFINQGFLSKKDK